MFDDLDDDDLIGGAPPVRPQRRYKPSTGHPVGRPSKEETERRLEERAAASRAGKIDLPDTARFYRPVGVKFLADVFRMEQRTVLKKLMKCPIVEETMERGRLVPKWDFKLAAQHLVDPKIDLESWIKSQRVQDLPPHINDQFWKAMRSRQAWEREAKHLWHDVEVLGVLGETAQMIRDVSLLWVSELPDKTSLSTENYHALRDQVADLLTQIKGKLEVLPQQRRTESVLRTMDDVIRKQDDDAFAESDYELDEDLVG